MNAARVYNSSVLKCIETIKNIWVRGNHQCKSGRRSQAPKSNLDMVKVQRLQKVLYRLGYNTGKRNRYIILR